MNANARDSNGIRPYLGVALVSASVLALQVIFTRIFSIMIWHHFTYLIVGIALLGGGAAGVFLAVRNWKKEVLTRRLGVMALAFSLSVLVTLLAITVVQFDPLRMGDLLPTLLGLALYFVCLFTTFMLGGGWSSRACLAPGRTWRTGCTSPICWARAPARWWSRGSCKPSAGQAP